MFHRREKLDVGAQSAPEGCARLGAQTEGEFALEHEDGRADDGAVGEEFEDEWGGDLAASDGALASRAGLTRPCMWRWVRTWYGVFEMQTSKYGSSALTKSPIISSNFRCSGLCLDQPLVPAHGPENDSLAEDTLRHFAGHPRVHLDRDDFPALFEDADGKVACSGTDFEDDVGLFEVGLEGKIHQLRGAPHGE